MILADNGGCLHQFDCLIHFTCIYWTWLQRLSHLYSAAEWFSLLSLRKGLCFCLVRSCDDSCRVPNKCQVCVNDKCQILWGCLSFHFDKKATCHTTIQKRCPGQGNVHIETSINDESNQIKCNISPNLFFWM